METIPAMQRSLRDGDCYRTREAERLLKRSHLLYRRAKTLAQFERSLPVAAIALFAAFYLWVWRTHPRLWTLLALYPLPLVVVAWGVREVRQNAEFEAKMSHRKALILLDEHQRHQNDTETWSATVGGDGRMAGIRTEDDTQGAYPVADAKRQEIR